jgi:hypothetical protein
MMVLTPNPDFFATELIAILILATPKEKNYHKIDGSF